MRFIRAIVTCCAFSVCLVACGRPATAVLPTSPSTSPETSLSWGSAEQELTVAPTVILSRSATTTTPAASLPVTTTATVTAVSTDTLRSTLTATVTRTALSTQTKIVTSPVTVKVPTTVVEHETTTVVKVVNHTSFTTAPAPSAVAAPGSASTTSTSSQDSGSNTDKGSVLLHAGRVVEDVKEADQRLGSGDNSGLDSTMSFLATDFSDLQSDGAPPGSNAPQYLATCKTESNFADLASQEFAAGKDTDAIARYKVLRQHVNDVLHAINTAYGSHYSV